MYTKASNANIVAVFPRTAISFCRKKPGPPCYRTSVNVRFSLFWMLGCAGLFRWSGVGFCPTMALGWLLRDTLTTVCCLNDLHQDSDYLPRFALKTLCKSLCFSPSCAKAKSFLYRERQAQDLKHVSAYCVITNGPSKCVSVCVYIYIYIYIYVYIYIYIYIYTHVDIDCDRRT